eukprot:Opistho-2@81274
MAADGVSTAKDHASEKHTKTAVRVVMICFFWYFSSACANNVGKSALLRFPFPMTVTLVQLLSISLYMTIVLRVLKVYPQQPITRESYIALILPLALGKIFASVASQVSIWRVPISYAHTVKAIAPIFTVILSRIVLKERQTFKVYLSLVPIIAGIMLATVSEISFDLLGMVSALFSTFVFAIQNIYSKKLMVDRRFDHMNLLLYTSRLAGLILFPVWCLTDAPLMAFSETPIIEGDTSIAWLTLLLVVDGFCNFAQNVMAFSLLSLVSPLSYSVANTTKRIVVILAGVFTFRNSINSTNMVAMAMAIAGVAYYNVAKYEQNVVKHTLPHTGNGGAAKVVSRDAAGVVIQSSTTRIV